MHSVHVAKRGGLAAKRFDVGSKPSVIIQIQSIARPHIARKYIQTYADIILHCDERINENVFNVLGLLSLGWGTNVSRVKT